jgi:choline dehydrogenase-like flavoprotein
LIRKREAGGFADRQCVRGGGEVDGADSRLLPDRLAGGAAEHIRPVTVGPVQARIISLKRCLASWICQQSQDPESAGTVLIASGRPDDEPLVDPRYLSAPADRPWLRDGVRQGLALLTSRALHDQVELLTGSPLETDAQIDAYIDATLVTSFHPVGTARMGSGPDAVVTPNLDVRGFSGLWVTDASVMPRIVRGLTQAPTIAIAERAAHFIAATRL